MEKKNFFSTLICKKYKIIHQIRKKVSRIHFVKFNKSTLTFYNFFYTKNLTGSLKKSKKSFNFLLV